VTYRQPEPPPQPHEIQREALGAVRTAGLVVQPSVVGAKRARALLEEHPKISWAVVLNRLGPDELLAWASDR
jgi:hypothetical protein